MQDSSQTKSQKDLTTIEQVSKMHVLTIPSEEFIPANSPLSGIFQYHQVSILKRAGYKVGVISINLSFTIPMIAKALVLKCINKKANNSADNFSFKELVALGYNKINKPESFITKELIDDIPVIRIDGFYYYPPMENKNHFGWINAGLTAFKNYIELYGKPDIVHAHNAIYAGMLAQKIKEKYRIDYILTEHSTVYERRIITEKRILKRVKQAYQSSNGLYAVSQPFCSFLNRSFKIDRFQTLPNVLDPYLENFGFIKSNEHNRAYTFLNIAELHPKKDHQTLIRAFKNVLKTYPDAVLCIGGNGDLAETLHSLVRDEKLEHAVKFLGLLNRNQVLHWLQKADCFVLSSKFETFGVVVIEAMLFGIPVIATKCGGPEDIINDKNGILVQVENKDQMEKAMVDMMSHQRQYKAEEIRDFAISNYGKNIFLQRIKLAYAQAKDYDRKN